MLLFGATEAHMYMYYSWSPLYPHTRLTLTLQDLITHYTETSSSEALPSKPQVSTYNQQAAQRQL
jgi:hypothetical protein